MLDPLQWIHVTDPNRRQDKGLGEPSKARSHHSATSVVTALAASVWFGITPASVFAQQQSVNVLIDASYVVPRKRFLDEIRNQLEPEARDAVSFVG